MHWQIGFDGVAITASKVLVREKNGSPFIVSGVSEMGVALLPLMKGRLIIRRINLQEPEVWLVRLSNGCWNFADLLRPGPDIRFLALERGVLHLRDQSAGSSTFSPYDFQGIGLRFAFPRQGSCWPVFLNGRMPRNGYTTSFKATIIGNGLIDEWRKQEYRFNINVDQLNPKDFAFIAANLPDLGGSYKLQLTGGGKFCSGIHAKSTADIVHMVLPTPSIGTLVSERATTSATLMLDPGKLQWRDLLLSFGNVEIRSNGQICRWQEDKPTYEASVDCNVKDLSRLSSYMGKGGTTGSESLNKRQSSQEKRLTFAQLFPPVKLTGEAQLSMKLHGNNTGRQLSTAIRAKGLSASDVLAGGIGKCFPWLSAVLSQPASKLSGEIKIAQDERIDLPGADITAGGSNLHIAGFWDKRGKQADLKLSGHRIDLSVFVHNLSSSQEFARLLAGKNGLATATGLVASGLADLTGSYEKHGDSGVFKLAAILYDASLRLKGRSLSVGHLNGRIYYDGAAVSFENIHGELGGGPFTVTGKVSVSGRPLCELAFQGKDIDLGQVYTALKILDVKVPLFSQHQLYGKVRQLSMKVTGTPEVPVVSLTLIPADLYYLAPGVGRPLRATAGTITYDDDRLVLRGVQLFSQNNQLMTDLDITNLSTTADLKQVNVKSSGIDLSELNYFLSSALMPPALRQGYLDFVSHLQLVNAKGKAYGNLLWQAKEHNKFALDGVVGLYNTSLKLGSAAWPIEHLSGIFAASGDELLVQNCAGSLGGNSFSADGHVTNYRRSDARWQTEFKAEVNPDKALRLVPGLAEEFGGKILTAGTLSLRALGEGDLKSATTVFSLRADPGDRVRVRTAIGLISQPPGQSATLDGSLTINAGLNGSAQLNSCNLIVGPALLQAKGKYVWSDPAKAVKPAFECNIRAPNLVPVATVMAVLGPFSQTGGVSGAVTGELDTQGRIDSLTSRGYLTFENVTLPPYKLYEFSGRVESPGWSFDCSDLKAPAIAGSQTNLQIDFARLGALEIRELSANILLARCEGQPNQSAQKIVLRDGKAHLAGGSFTTEGWIDLTDHKLHVKADLKRVQAGQIASSLTGRSGDISGWADASLVLDSAGAEWNQMLSNLDGWVKIAVESGKLASFGQLQERLAQANLIQSGILGFNLNNLVQSVMPVKTGAFHDLDVFVSLAKGVMTVKQLKFGGDDLRLQAAGTVNPVLRTISLNVSGDLPRVSSSVLSGALGDVSRGLSIQKLISLLTLHKLENLPPLPILGAIADDRPRSFTFHIVAPLNDKHMIGQSIQKSFRWLPHSASAQHQE